MSTGLYIVTVAAVGILALAVLFKLAGWSQYKSNAGTLAAAGIILLTALLAIAMALKY